MSFSNEFDNSQVISEINMTPLVDVMLVLLIIFMITLPVLTHSVKIDLPQAESNQNEIKPDLISLSITENAQIYWNENLVDKNELLNRLKLAAAKNPQPELQLRGDRHLEYEVIMHVMAAAQKAGIQKLGFVTQL